MSRSTAITSATASRPGDVLIDMWIPDLVEAHKQKIAATHRAEVQIEVAESALRGRRGEARDHRGPNHLSQGRRETGSSQLHSLGFGIQAARDARQPARPRRAGARRDVPPVRGSRRGRDQADAMVLETTADRDRAVADRDKARVDVEAARADLEVAKADERQAKVLLDYGQIKAPYDGVITQRNVSPGDYLQPGGSTSGRPIFVLEQIDPVRVFVGVPELASFFIHEGDIGADPVPGARRESRATAKSSARALRSTRPPAPCRPRSTSRTRTATSIPAGTPP